MASSGVATGSYTVTEPSTLPSASGVATGTYAVTVPVVAPSASGVATGTYTVTGVTVIPTDGFYLSSTGVLSRPAVYLATGGALYDMADGATSGPIVTSPETKLLYVGDSLTVGGVQSSDLASRLQGLGYDLTIRTGTGSSRSIGDGNTIRLDALVGRGIVENTSPYPTPGALDVINDLRTSGYHFNLAVVGLISNNFGQTVATLKPKINQLLDLILVDPVTKVLWIGPVVRPGSTLQTQVDTYMYPALNQIVTERAGKVVLLNLQAEIRGRSLNEESPPLWVDDRHMTSAGYALRNQIIADRMTAEGMGYKAAVTYIPGNVPATVTANV